MMNGRFLLDTNIKDFYSGNITEKLNAIYDDVANDSKMDKELYQAQLKALGNENW